jgi:hypothetical protein
MDVTKWTGVLKLFLLNLVDEVEKYINKKNGQESSPTLASALFNSMKFIVLEQVDGLVNQAVAYTKTQIEELSSLLARKLSVLLASMVYILTIMGVLMLAYIFMMVSLALYLGDEAGSTALGFLYVGGGNLVIAILIYRFGQETLQTRIRTYMESLL